MLHITPDDWEAIRLSLKVGLWSVAGSLPPGFLLAYAFSRFRFPGKAILTAVVHLPLVLPPVVTGFALLVLFGNRGPLGHLLASMGMSIAFRWTGAAVAAAVMGLPLMVRAMRLSLDAVDRRLETAAMTLGASRRRAFFTITLPLSMPGVIAGAILSFAKSFGEFGATITFVSNIPGETRTVPIAIYSLLQAPGGEAPALQLTLVSVVVSLTAVLGAEALERRFARAARGDRP
jgi:molybdate transport system permease protein